MNAKFPALALTVLFAFMAALPAARADTPAISLSPVSGPPGTLITLSGTGFSPGVGAEIRWFTMEGNRVSGSGFVETNWTITNTVADGTGRLSASFAAPYDLGGPPHRIEAVVGGAPVAEAYYTLSRNIWITPTSGPEGTVVAVNLVAGGWTHYDNNVAITYDNAFLGFACSFNSQGNITVYVQAMGGVGHHVIGVYPALYYGPSDGPTPWKHPLLNPADLPVRYEPEEFVFQITGSGAESSFPRATSILGVTAPDSLAIQDLPANPGDGSAPFLGLGNGATGIVGGNLPIALSGFPANAPVSLQWITVSGTTKIEADKNRGWVFTPRTIDLGEFTVSAAGSYAATLQVPKDFGGDHALEALVGGQVLATATWKLVPAFTADLSADGTRINLHATGLGWEKYTATWDVLYDNRLMGAITAMTSEGSVDVSIPVVGAPGVHTIDIHEGSNGWPYLNMHQSPWPWEPVYRFAVTIPEPAAPQPAGGTVSVWFVPPLLVFAAVLGFGIARVRRRRKPEPTE